MNKDKYIDLVQSEVMRDYLKTQELSELELCKIILFAHIPLTEKAKYISCLVAETNNPVVCNVEKWLYGVLNILSSPNYIASISSIRINDKYDWHNSSEEYLSTIRACDLEEFISDIRNVPIDDYDYIEIRLHNIGTILDMKNYMSIYGFLINEKMELIYIDPPDSLYNMKVVNVDFSEDQEYDVYDVFFGHTYTKFPFESNDYVELHLPVFKDPIIGRLYYQHEFVDDITTPIYSHIDPIKDGVIDEVNSIETSFTSFYTLTFLGCQNWLYPHTIERKDK